MQPIATDVAHSVVCVSVCVKTAEPIKVLFGGLTYVDPRNHLSDGS